MTKVYKSKSTEETRAIGKKIGETLTPGSVLALSGDLGTGKTAFTQGIAEGLQIDEWVNSPTFTVIQQYEGGRLPLYHLDVYRIEDPSELEEIGVDEALFGEGVCVIEWAEMVEEILPENTVHITIEKNLEKGFDYRTVTVEEQ